ncbi:uncharacterized protein V6R79_013178 [Siganus canaliculatus]
METPSYITAPVSVTYPTHSSASDERNQLLLAFSDCASSGGERLLLLLQDGAVKAEDICSVSLLQLRKCCVTPPGPVSVDANVLFCSGRSRCVFTAPE